MNITNELWLRAMNNGIYEIFIIIGMYLVFSIMFHLKGTKGKIFFFVFFISMFCFNEMIFIFNNIDMNHREVIVTGLALMNTLIYIVVLKILTEADYLHVFLADLIAQTVTPVIVSLLYVVVTTLFRRNVDMIIVKGGGYTNGIVLLTLLPVMVIALNILRFISKKWLSGFQKKKLKWRKILGGIVLLFNGAGFFVCIKNNIRSEETIIIPMMAMLMITVIFLYGASWLVRYRIEKRTKKENRILSIENAVMKEYYDTLDYQMERTKKFRHDIEKHMSVLKEMVAANETSDELMNYASQIEEQYESLQTIDYCGNPVVNAILVNKKYQCQEQGIDMEIKIGKFESGKIKEIDLVAVISNVLDNAIEGCMNIQGNTERKIHFQCGNLNDTLFIHVQNTVDAANKDFAVMQKKTWKRDTYAHGVGLSIVEEIVEKYDGEIETVIQSEKYKTYIQLKIC